MNIWNEPSWLAKYRDGDVIGRSQAHMAYATYYGLDGEGDLNPECEERLGYSPQPLTAYASRTGTKQNLDAMRKAGWRLLVSAAGVVRTEGFERYALDNGAWSAYTQGKEFDELAFGRALDLVGEQADWVVIPDRVAAGKHSLDFSLKWLERLRHCPVKLLLAVQDGMEIDDVRELVNPAVGIFLGGTTEWKLKTMEAWGVLARRKNAYFHVGRVNSALRIGKCANAGAQSFDGTSVTRFSKTLPRLDNALNYATEQKDLFAIASEDVHDTPFDCRWPFQQLAQI
jgi:hypothetical protein